MHYNYFVIKSNTDWTCIFENIIFKTCLNRFCHMSVSCEVEKNLDWRLIVICTARLNMVEWSCKNVCHIWESYTCIAGTPVHLFRCHLKLWVQLEPIQGILYTQAEDCCTDGSVGSVSPFILRVTINIINTKIISDRIHRVHSRS